MSFDKVIERRGTTSSKWDLMQAKFGVSAADGISMWTADSDYPTAPCVIDAVRRAADHGIFGYSFPSDAYKDAIRWWMETRHGWMVERDWILTTQGLGHGITTCLQAVTEPGDTVAFFTPVYHEFRIKTEKNNRKVLELPLKRDGDTYVLDFEDAASRLSPEVKVLIWCSPQNPSGRIWTRDELRAVATFCAEHDLILFSDEIHHDLILIDETFVPMDVAAPEHRNRTINMTSASKTFNIAGMKTGNLIIPDPDLRARVHAVLHAADYAPNALGMKMVEAAYSPEGAAWVDEQLDYLKENKRVLDEGLNAIPGIRSLPIASTYLPWVDFTNTGMTMDEVLRRIQEEAKIAVAPGPQFGAGGEMHIRFNIAAPRATIEATVQRMKAAFADLQ